MKGREGWISVDWRELVNWTLSIIEACGGGHWRVVPPFKDDHQRPGRRCGIVRWSSAGPMHIASAIMSIRDRRTFRSGWAKLGYRTPMSCVFALTQYGQLAGAAWDWYGRGLCSVVQVETLDEWPQCNSWRDRDDHRVDGNVSKCYVKAWTRSYADWIIIYAW